MKPSEVISLKNGIKLLQERADELSHNYQYATPEGANTLRAIARLAYSLYQEAKSKEKAMREQFVD